MQRKKSDRTIYPLVADIFYGAMLAAIVAIMPLVVRLAIRYTPLELWYFFPPTQTNPTNQFGDVFAYWKGVALILPVVSMVLFMVFSWLGGMPIPFFKPYFKKIPIILALIYLGFVFISAIASSYTRTAWFGTREREEGALMWLMYFMAFAAAMFYVERGEKYAKPVMWGLTLSGIAMGAIGVSQLFGDGFFALPFAERLMTAGTEVESITLNFDIAHGTLYNPNTFGKYTAMVAPLLLIYAGVYKGRWEVKGLMFLGGALMLVGVFASGSLGGLIGITTAAIVLVVTYVGGLVANRSGGGKGAMRAIGAFVLVGVLAGAAILLVPPLNHRATTLFNRLVEANAANTEGMERFEFVDNTLVIYRGGSPQLSIEVTVDTLSQGNAGDWMVVRDGAGNPVEPTHRQEPTTEDPGGYVYQLPGGRTITIDRFSDFFFIRPGRQATPLLLTMEDGRIHGFRSAEGPFYDLTTPVPAWGFAGRETWGSSRGYIWSRSFPLLPRRAIIGSGPDTFTLVFPYYDMAGLQLSFNNPYQIVDKAHNLFIQTWITTGGISAIVLFLLFGHYLFTTFVSLVRDKKENLPLYGLRLGLLVSVSAFVMSSMATDSTIGSTGVFFVLLGVGYGLNYSWHQSKLNATPQAR